MLDLVAIEHTRSIADEDEATAHERPSISVRFTCDTLSSGWVKESFRERGGQARFLVMTAVAGHARPLHGGDPRLVVSRGVVAEAKEGRLYARHRLGAGR
jgi:hypothetical protein